MTDTPSTFDLDQLTIHPLDEVDAMELRLSLIHI